MSKPKFSMKTSMIVVVVLAATFFMGRITGKKTSDDHSMHTDAAEVTSWTCSMHPQIDLP